LEEEIIMIYYNGWTDEELAEMRTIHKRYSQWYRDAQFIDDDYRCKVIMYDWHIARKKLEDEVESRKAIGVS
jgi:hypothetical protein